MEINCFSLKRTFVCRLREDFDLYDELTKIAIQKNIQLAKISLIGAVKCGKVGYFNQTTKEYQIHTFKKPMEIISCLGNISLKENIPFVHCHIVFSDENGNAFGGHLFSGTKVFACEVFIDEYEGSVERNFDNSTSLFLWEDKCVIK